VNPIALARSTRDPARATAYPERLVFWLNGIKAVVANPDPSVMLAGYLHSVGLILLLGALGLMTFLFELVTQQP
jgi:hypothetical protein